MDQGVCRGRRLTKTLSIPNSKWIPSYSLSIEFSTFFKGDKVLGIDGLGKAFFVEI